MSVCKVAQLPSKEVPTLQVLCAQQVRTQIDEDFASKAANAPAPRGPSSLSLTTARVLETLRSVTQKGDSVSKKIPWTLLELIAHPYALVEWQKSVLVQLHKENRQVSVQNVLYESENVWRLLCEQNGWLPKQTDPEMTWEQRYFKERIAKVMMRSYGNFESIDQREWHLFNLNRSRVQVLEFDRNPWIKEKKLKELCALFSEITTFRVNGCTGMEEKDWVEVFSRLKKVVHADLGNHMTIGAKALNALAKNTSNLCSLNIAAIAYNVELQAIITLLRKSPKLNALVLGEKKNLQDLSQLLQVLSVCRCLTSLELRGFKKLKMKDVEEIASRFPGIEKLIIRNCPEFRSDDLDSLSEHPQLKHLEIADCPNFDPDQVYALAQKCCNLEKYICGRSAI